MASAPIDRWFDRELASTSDPSSMISFSDGLKSNNRSEVPGAKKTSERRSYSRERLPSRVRVGSAHHCERTSLFYLKARPRRILRSTCAHVYARTRVCLCVCVCACRPLECSCIGGAEALDRTRLTPKIERESRDGDVQACSAGNSQWLRVAIESTQLRAFIHCGAELRGMWMPRGREGEKERQKNGEAR
jgi:hypothetical protein